MSGDIVNQVKSLFVNTGRFEFQKVAGQDASGVAICFRDKEAGPNRFSRFVVKTAGLGTYREILNEAKWLRRIGRAEHIVTPISLDSNPLFGKRGDKRVPLLDKPHIVIEYLENGSLDSLLVRRRAAGAGRLPNRILWAIFLCLTKACLAMAKPPAFPFIPKGPQDKVPEEMPGNRDGAAGNLIHTDMNLGNLMFGNRVVERIPQGPPPPLEHGLVPILKLIDFGDAKEATEPEVLPRDKSFDRELNLAARVQEDVNRLEIIGKSPNDGRGNFRSVATDINILEIGVVMGRLITNDLANPGAGVLRETMVELRDNLLAAQDPTLDFDLFWLVARCLACLPALRPRLSHLLDLLENYSSTKKYERFRAEADDVVELVVDHFILDPTIGRTEDTTIVLSPDSLRADVSIASLDDAQGEISVISLLSSEGDESMRDIGTSRRPIELDVSLRAKFLFLPLRPFMLFSDRGNVTWRQFNPTC